MKCGPASQSLSGLEAFLPHCYATFGESARWNPAVFESTLNSQSVTGRAFIVDMQDFIFFAGGPDGLEKEIRRLSEEAPF